jgi:hypothetical protein
MVDDVIVQNLKRRFRILGICWLVYGLLRVIDAVWLVFFGNTVTLMFGALLNRVPNPFAMMSDFHLFYGFLIAFSAICGVLGVLAGLALLAVQRVGRTLALVAAFLSLSGIPLGITLGIYSLIILLPLNFRSLPEAAADRQSANLSGRPVTLP